jgi:hypothetical protein
MTDRLSRLAAILIAALAAASCGGGGGSEATFDVGVVVAGQPQPAIFPGHASTLAIHAGQSIELDATEPVIWAFSVNGSPAFESGTTVQIGGLVITQSDLSPSRVVIDTALVGPTVLPVFVRLTATSTFDAALVVDLTLQVD